MLLDEMVRPRTIKETLVDTLREAILRGDLKQGAPLREEELGNSLKVARGTLREAFHLLQQEGLVQVYPHKGAFVTSLTERNINEIFSSRILIEPYLVDIAMKNGAYDSQVLRDIEKHLHRLGKYEQQVDVFGRLKTDVEFHYLICVPAGHQVLLDFLKNIQSQTLLCVMNYLNEPDSILQEPLHREILDSIRSGDRGRTRKILEDHLEEGKNGLLAGLARAEAKLD